MLTYLPTHRRRPLADTLAIPQDGEGVSFQRLCVMVLFVGETPQRADGRVPMFGSPVEVAVGIAAATAKVMALFHSPQDEARSSHQIFQPTDGKSIHVSKTVCATQ